MQSKTKIATVQQVVATLTQSSFSVVACIKKLEKIEVSQKAKKNYFRRYVRLFYIVSPTN